MIGNATKRKPGRPVVNRKRDAAVVQILKRHLDELSDILTRPTLEAVCADLDAARVPIPEPWLNGTSRILHTYGLSLCSWSDGVELGFYSLLHHELNYIRRRSSAGASQEGQSTAATNSGAS
jgi:hypothetical protein